MFSSGIEVLCMVNQGIENVLFCWVFRRLPAGEAD
jgi:hypothetical protein